MTTKRNIKEGLDTGHYEENESFSRKKDERNIIVNIKSLSE